MARQCWPNLREATTFGALHVPRWGYDYVKPISEGTDRARVLDPLGIGHYTNTAMPGEVGNFSIAGHRTTYGKPFTDIQDLKVGDALVVQTDTAWYVYRVTSSEIVQPHLHGGDRAHAGQAWRRAHRRVDHPDVVPPQVLGRAALHRARRTRVLGAHRARLSERDCGGRLMYGWIWRHLPGPRWARATIVRTGPCHRRC